MRSIFAFYRSRSFLDTLGLVALLLLLTGTAFHFEMGHAYLYYRELFAAIFAGLWLLLLLTRTEFLPSGQLRMHKALFYLILFPVLLVLWSFIDPGVPLYGGNDFAIGVSEYVDASNATLYVLRNALLYIPMVLYFSLRGLNQRELRLIALFVVLIAPLSIAAYLQSEEIATLNTLGLVAELGGAGIAYNSYVPFLTFPVLSGIYLLVSPCSLRVKAIVLPCTVIVCIFILLSTSRQSVLFIILTILVFYYFAERKRRWGKRFNFVVMSLVSAFAFYTIVGDTQFNDRFLLRFGSLGGFIGDGTGRGDAALNGLRMLDPIQWVSGAGLTSIINSGPHNDYVRWTQRVGVILMLIGFMPFFVAFWKSCKLISKVKQGNTLYVFLALAVGFTLFHSLFGYPREDAYQAPYVYLGLALWFGALREGLLKPSIVRADTRRVASSPYVSGKSQGSRSGRS